MAKSHRKPGEWMQLPIDDRIIEVLNLGLRLSPTIIAENIDKSREEVNRRLGVLVEHGLVKKVATGRYEISGNGRDYLEGDLDARELEEE